MNSKKTDNMEQEKKNWKGKAASAFETIVKWLPRTTLIFAWYDLWIGAYWDSNNKRLYILPIPCCGIVFDWKYYEEEKEAQAWEDQREAMFNAWERKQNEKAT